MIALVFKKLRRIKENHRQIKLFRLWLDLEYRYGLTFAEVQELLPALQKGFSLGLIRGGIYPIKDGRSSEYDDPLLIGIKDYVTTKLVSKLIAKTIISHDYEFICILFQGSIIAAKRRGSVTADWIRKAISRFQKKESHILASMKIVKVIRGIFWMTPFAAFVLLLKTGPQNNFISLWLLFGAIMVMAGLYETREDAKKAFGNTITVLIVIILAFGPYIGYLYYTGYFFHFH